MIFSRWTVVYKHDQSPIEECLYVHKAHAIKKHNLMKIGSSIPDEVAREIYESAYLAGDVYNKNAEVLFHNYTHD